MMLRLTNTSGDPVSAHCFYVNENRHCTNDFSVCADDEDCSGDATCAKGATETDFSVHLTPYQPIAWRLSDGLFSSEFPLDGVQRVGPGGHSNAGSRIPPAPEDPFVGWMECISVTTQGSPVEANALTGAGVLYEALPSRTETAEYGAIGIQAVAGAANGDAELLLGTEYSGCPGTITMSHFFDGAIEPAARTSRIATTLVLVPCSADYLRQIFPSTAIRFTVFNEFGQRFDASIVEEGQFVSALSKLDTASPATSIFSAGVAGTLTGKTRFQSTATGVVGIGIEEHTELGNPAEKSRAVFKLQAISARTDRIVLP